MVLKLAWIFTLRSGRGGGGGGVRRGSVERPAGVGQGI